MQEMDKRRPAGAMGSRAQVEDPSANAEHRCVSACRACVSTVWCADKKEQESENEPDAYDRSKVKTWSRLIISRQLHQRKAILIPNVSNALGMDMRV
jgi:hypothetical protein